ncbi:MAG: DUF5723 family protein [Bacteroidales bacterium]|nr:DUF5723 family protein [Bacteroidales bacterium]MDD4234446.1 DUF5723 family protein [Bacteroidales bacterium]
MKKLLFLIIGLCFVFAIHAQQDFTLYYMDRAMQSQWVNPSHITPHKVNIGGMIVPLFGQIPPAMHFNYANSALKYNDIFHMGTGLKSDSLVLDLPKFMANVRAVNHMSFENHFELFSLGLKSDKMFVTFAITEKFNYGISLPGDLFELAINGNKQYMDENKPLDFSRLNLSATYYREFAFGMSLEATEKLRVGARLKVLFGIANLNTNIRELSLYTNPDNVYMTANTDMSMQFTTPIPVEYNYYSDGDSASLEFAENPEDYLLTTDFFFNMKNPGIAFDIGATYNLNNKIDLFFSATDLGFISWNSNPLSLTSKGNFLMKGIEVQFWNDEDQVDADLNAFADSLLNTFHFEGNKESYFTMLPANVYIGGKYKLYDKIHFGALYRAEFYKKSVLSSFTLSANSNLTKWFTAHLSYTVANNNWSNLGFGFTLRGAFIQYFFVTDNFLGAIFPQKAQNLNFRMGCNLVFGREKEIKSDSFY